MLKGKNDAQRENHSHMGVGIVRICLKYILTNFNWIWNLIYIFAVSAYRVNSASSASRPTYFSQCRCVAGVADDVVFAASTPPKIRCPNNYLQFSAPSALSPLAFSLSLWAITKCVPLLLPLIDCRLTIRRPFPKDPLFILPFSFCLLLYDVCVEISFIRFTLGLGFRFSAFSFRLACNFSLSIKIDWHRWIAENKTKTCCPGKDMRPKERLSSEEETRITWHNFNWVFGRSTPLSSNLEVG